MALAKTSTRLSNDEFAIFQIVYVNSAPDGTIIGNFQSRYRLVVSRYIMLEARRSRVSSVSANHRSSISK